MPTSTEPMDDYDGTSGLQIQPAPTDPALLTKEYQPASGDQADCPPICGNIRSIYWAQRVLNTHGFRRWSFSFPPPVEVRSDSQVSVSMTEIDGNGKPFIGNATMLVYNVVPFDDSTIIVQYNVDFGSNLRILFNFTIVN